MDRAIFITFTIVITERVVVTSGIIEKSFAAKLSAHSFSRLGKGMTLLCLPRCIPTRLHSLSPLRQRSEK